MHALTANRPFGRSRLKEFLKGFRALRLLKYHLFPTEAMRKIKEYNISDGDVVLDFGAHIGEIARVFLDLGAIVHAYEPNPVVYDVLSRRLGGHADFFAYQIAVSDHNGLAKFYLPEEHKEDELRYSEAGSLRLGTTSGAGDTIDVRVCDVADVIAQFDRVKLVKIDIEGEEYSVIHRLLPYMDKIDHMIVETHHNMYKCFEPDFIRLRESIRRHGCALQIDLNWI